jgi:rhodanese-related sulfurtransferase
LRRLDRLELDIETIEPAEAISLLGSKDVVFVDLRDGYELEQFGLIEGARHCPRGSLEFRIPPQSPWHEDFFARKARFVFYCSHGLRSILAVKTARELGLENVCHIRGGMKAWEKAGGPTSCAAVSIPASRPAGESNKNGGRKER